MSKFIRFFIALSIISIIAFLSYGLAMTLRCKGIGSSDTAGWVQAIGATVALGLAVWVPYKQKLDAAHEAERQRKDNERRVCLAFRDELSLLRQHFDGEGVLDILRDAPDEIVDFEIPVPRERFPIYASMIGRITEIDSEELRRGIIEAYEPVNRLIDLGSINNRRLLELSSLLRKYSHMEMTTPAANELADCRRILVNLRQGMKLVCQTGIERVNKTLALLDRKLEEHS